MFNIIRFFVVDVIDKLMLLTIVILLNISVSDFRLSALKNVFCIVSVLIISTFSFC